jgi:hypothetical protein
MLRCAIHGVAQWTCKTHQGKGSRTPTRNWRQCSPALAGQTRALAMTNRYQWLRSPRHETSQGSCTVDICLLPSPKSGYTALAPRATVKESLFLPELRAAQTRLSSNTLYSKPGLRRRQQEQTIRLTGSCHARTRSLWPATVSG